MNILAQAAATGWAKYITPTFIGTTIRVIIIAAIGFPVLFFISSVAGRMVGKRFSKQTSMLVRKAIFYTGAVFLIVTILMQADVNLTPLLGAAGVVGLAIGFASQTSVSNIISGLFLISEKPFAVGDAIKVGDTTGIVLSIDLLSVKLRQFDNRFVRIPNEMLIKSEVTNITHFPIRRLDIKIGVAYRENVGKVRQVLLDVAAKTTYCLDEPEPIVIFDKFGDSSLDFTLCVWSVKEEFLLMQNTIMQSIKERFDAEGIDIPFPQRVVSAEQPVPVRIVESKNSLEL